MVKIRPYTKPHAGLGGGHHLRLPSGEVIRERVKSPVTSKSGAMDWGGRGRAPAPRGLHREEEVSPRPSRVLARLHGGPRPGRTARSTRPSSRLSRSTRPPRAGLRAMRLYAITDEAVETFKAP